MYKCNSSEINFVRFDENFDVIKIDSEKNDSTLLIENNCYSINYYSFLFMSNEYKLIGQIICKGQRATALYSIPSEYEPKTIYSDLSEVENSDGNNSSPNSEKPEKSEVQNTFISSLISNTNLESTFISSKPSFFECGGYKINDGTICSESIPNGYYLLDILNKIIEKCHKTCNTCEKSPIDNNNNCVSCKKNFNLNINNNCIYKYNYYFDDIIEEII